MTSRPTETSFAASTSTSSARRPARCSSTRERCAGLSRASTPLRSTYVEPYASFRRRFCSLDDGHAAQRVVDAVFRLDESAAAR